MARKAKKDGIPYYQLGRDLPVPRKFAEFARRRVGGLAAFDQCHRSLIDLLANAYILGMKDVIDAEECGNATKDTPD